jgi:hypothetical protein
VIVMRAPVTKLLALILTVALAVSAADAATKKKSRVKRAPTVATDYDGTPIIMKGMSTGYPSSIMKDELGTRSRTTATPKAEPDATPKTGETQTRPIRRVGSSTYVPPPNPSPMAGGPSPQEILRGAPQLNPAPSVNNSFSDRVTRCNHSFALGAGVGNNPTTRDAYVRSCAN